MTPRWTLALPAAAFLLLTSCVHQTLPVAPNTSVPRSRRFAEPARTGVAKTMQRQVLNAADLGEGDLEIRHLRARVSTEPDNREARLHLAALYADRGYPELAAEHYRLLTERFPDLDAARLGLIRSLYSQSLLTETAAEIERCLAERPASNAAFSSWLGIVYDDLGYLDKAEAAHRAALALDPSQAALHNNLGYNLLLQSKKAEAAAEFRQALAANPKSVIALNNLALSLSSQPAEALKSLTQTSDPATAHSNLAAVLIDEGQYLEARKEIEKALSYKRDHPAALTNLKLLSELENRPATAPAAPEPNTRWRRIKRFLKGPEDRPAVGQHDFAATAPRANGN